MSDIVLSKLKGAVAVAVGQSAYFHEHTPVVYSIAGATMLRSGHVETDESEYNVDFWADNRVVIAQTTPSTSPAMQSITYGNGLFVAVGSSGTVWTSVDAVTWVNQTTPSTSPAMESITYGNGLFVAVGNSGTVWTSVDGITWVNQTTPSSSAMRGITYGNGLYIAVGDSGNVWTYQEAAGSLTENKIADTYQYIRIL